MQDKRHNLTSQAEEEITVHNQESLPRDQTIQTDYKPQKKAILAMRQTPWDHTCTLRETNSVVIVSSPINLPINHPTKTPQH